MNAREAIIYCLCNVNRPNIDGPQWSQSVWDNHGDEHWIEFPVNQSASPRLCSDGPTPFSEAGEPYSE